MPRKKVYISSTFGDLKEYRHELAETLRFLGDYFEIVRIMEYMMPGNEGTNIDECLKDVRECNIYVLIIGKRYGSLVDGTEYSYTHTEFNCATDPKHKKIIIPLIADDKATGLETISTDDEAKFQAFKTEAQKYLPFGKNFSSPDHMSKQLLLALYRFSEKKWEINEEVKYYCNRENHYLDFVKEKKKGKLNLFTIAGRVSDRAKFFNDRMARLEFGLVREYVKDKIRTAEFMANGINENRFKQRILTKIMTNFINISESIPSTTAECFRYFVENKIDNIYLQFFLSKEDCSAKNVIKTLTDFLTELRKHCNDTGITFFIVIVFELPDERETDTATIKLIRAAQKKFKGFDLPELTLIDFDHIEHWVAKYILPQGSTHAEKIVSAHYEDREARFNMAAADKILSAIINDLKENSSIQ